MNTQPKIQEDTGFDWQQFSDVYKSDYGFRPHGQWAEEEAQQYLDARQRAYQHSTLVKEVFPLKTKVTNFGVEARVYGYESDDDQDRQGNPTHAWANEGLKLETLNGKNKWVADPKQCRKVKI